MADQNQPQPRVLDEDAKLDFLAKKAKRRYKSQVRKYRRQAENESSELNLTAMMDMMTILLVFLIKSYGAVDLKVEMGDNLTPPTSISETPPTLSVTLTVSKQEISVGEKGVLALEPGMKLPVQDSLIIPEVREALNVEVERIREQARYNPKMAALADTPQDPVRMLTVIAHKEMPYDVLFSVLASGGDVGLKYFKFLVVQSEVQSEG